MRTSRILSILFTRNRPFKSVTIADFEKWVMAEETVTHPLSIDLRQFTTSEEEGIDKTHDKFWNFVKNKSDEVGVAINLQAPSQAEPKIHNAIFNHELPKVVDATTKSPISNLTISTGIDKINISNAVIKYINIVGQIQQISLKYCYIGFLHLHKTQSSQLELILRNCRIGRIIFQPESVHSLSLYDCIVRDIVGPRPSAENPFGGSISFSNVDFAVSSKNSIIYGGPQQFRNLRSHLESLENQVEASKMRALELRSELEYETGINRLANQYQRFSGNYGLSPGRPLWFTFGIIVSVASFFYLTDGVSFGYAATNDLYGGWREAFLGEDCSARFARAIGITLQSLVNPLGIFGPRTLLIASTSFGHILTSLQGIVCDILIATTILAIRRRFKLH